MIHAHHSCFQRRVHPWVVNNVIFKDKTIENTLPSWFLPCTCYLPICKYLAKLLLDIQYILGTSPTNKPPFTPHHDLKVQFFEFTYCNDKFPLSCHHKRTRKHDILHTTLTQQGWSVLPPIIITTCISCTIHKATNKNLLDLESLTPKSTNVWKHSHKSLFHTSRTSSSTNGDLKRRKPQPHSHEYTQHNHIIRYILWN